VSLDFFGSTLTCASAISFFYLESVMVEKDYMDRMFGVQRPPAPSVDRL